jgi:rhodanese-related sulfurtransferase
MKTIALRRIAPLLILASIGCTCVLGGACAHVRAWAAKPRPPYRKLTPQVAYEMIRDSPGMLVLDLRTSQQFNGQTGHVQRAVNIPLARLPYRLLEIIPFREETILIYCETNECAEKGTSVLAASGFESIVLMDGGIQKWIKGGFKTVLPASMAGQAGHGEEDKAHVMPTRPGESRNDPKREVPVKPPAPPPDPDPAAAPPPPAGLIR